MLSKVEAEFLRNLEAFSADYAKQLKHRIRTKVLAVGRLWRTLGIGWFSGYRIKYRGYGFS